MVSEGAQAPAHREARQTSSVGAAVIAGVMGCALLGFGVPSLIAAVRTIEARAVIWATYTGAATPEKALLDAVADLGILQRWGRDGELEGDAGLLLLRVGQAAPTGAERDERFAASAAAFSAALAIAPGQPNAWANLAYLHLHRGDTAAAVAALRMSMLSGSFVPALMASRIELGLRLLPAMDPETVGLLQRQIRLTWTLDPDFVAKLSARPGLTPLVRDAMDGLSEVEMAQYVRRHGGQK